MGGREGRERRWTEGETGRGEGGSKEGRGEGGSERDRGEREGARREGWRGEGGREGKASRYKLADM